MMLDNLKTNIRKIKEFDTIIIHRHIRQMEIVWVVPSDFVKY